VIDGLALWWDEVGTRVPFSDSPLSLTFPIEQFWGRAARASWVRKNPDARFNFLVAGRRTECCSGIRLAYYRYYRMCCIAGSPFLALKSGNVLRVS